MAQLATFDTHKYIKELTASGFNEKQAEVIIKSILKGRDYDLSHLATKEQITKVKSALEKQIINTDNKITILDSKIEETKSELKKDIKVNISQLETKIEQGKNDVIKWMVGLLSPIYIGAVIVLVRWLVQG